MPAQDKIRIAFDTNVWISFSIGKRMNVLKAIFLDKRFHIFACPEIIEEYVRVSNTQKLRKYLTKKRIFDTLELIDQFTENKSVKSTKKLSRDPGDDFLLVFSQESELDYLITGDKDLLVFGKYHKTRIITFGEFLGIHF